MKFNNIILRLMAFAAVLLAGSCQQDEFDAPNDLAAFAWVISTESNNTDPIFETTSNYVSIIDASQGTIDHEWIISYDTGVRYLLDEIISSDDKDYSDNIDYSLTNINTKDAVHLTFTETGVQTVTLRNTYEREVSFTYSYREEGNSTRLYNTITSELIDGKHVLEFTFTFEIFNGTFDPTVRVYRDAAYTDEVEIGYATDSDGYKSVEIETGDYLYFVDETGDRTNSWGWTCDEAGISFPYSSSYQEAALQFVVLSEDNYDLPFIVKETLGRETDAANPSLPLSSTNYYVPLNIYVMPSSKPLECTVTQSSISTTVNFTINSQFQSESIASDSHSLFSLDVYNATSGYTATITPISCELEEGLGKNNLILTFSESLYNTDELKLTYNGGAGDISVSGDTPLSEKITEAGLSSVFDVVTDLISFDGFPAGECLDPSIFDFSSFINSSALSPEDLGWRWSSTGGVTTAGIDSTLSFVPDPTGENIQVLKAYRTTSDSGTADTASAVLINDYTFTAPAGNYHLEIEILYKSDEIVVESGVTLQITSTSSTSDYTFTRDSSTDGSTQGGGFYKTASYTSDTWVAFARSTAPSIPNSLGGIDRRFAITMNSFQGTLYIRKVSLTNAQDR